VVSYQHLEIHGGSLETIVLDASQSENIKMCAEVLKSGGLVAFPTETVYGLGANALDENSVAGIFEIKGRPQDNPLIVHVASIDDVEQLVTGVTNIFKTLASKYWPGPLTLVMRKSSNVPGSVTAGLDTVAIRMPEHPAALALIRASDTPLAAPSANPSGRPSPTKALHVMSDIGGKIPYILDGGDCKVGLESTVLDISGEIPRILRPGGVTYDELKSTLGNVELAGSEAVEKPMSPGMKYRHYAPKAPLTAVSGSPDKTAVYIATRMDDCTAALMFDDYALSHPNIVLYGHSTDYTAQAARLFDALRKLDSFDVKKIYAQLPQENELGYAVVDRIKKAAGSSIVDCTKE